METSNYVPTKRLRIMPTNVNECVREFKLPRKFPGMIPNLNSNSKNLNDAVIQTNTLSKLDGVKEFKVSQNLNQSSQKWRIKTPNGKDLGEIKVQLLPNNTKILKDESLKLSNKGASTGSNTAVLSTTAKTLYPPKKLINILPKNNGTKALILNSKCININPSSTTNKIVTIKKPSTGDTNQLVRKQQPLILGKRKLLSKHDDQMDGKNDYVSRLLLQKPTTKTVNIENKVQNSTLNSKEHKLIIVKSNLAAQLLNSNKTCNFNNTNSKVLVLTPMTSNKSKIDSSVIEYQQKNSFNDLGGTETSMESCKDNVNEIPDPDISESHNDRTFVTNRVRCFGGKNPNIRENQEKNISSPLKDIVINIGSHSSQTNNLNESQNDSNNYDMDESQAQLKLGKNVMVVVPNLQSDVSDDTCSNSKNYLMNLLQKIQSPENETSNVNSSENNPAKDNFSDNMKSENTINVLEAAFGSIANQELRSKALKVLAECGISLERKVPVRPPPDSMSVRDSLVQTDIFGLLEEKTFIFVNKNISGIERLPESSRHPYNCRSTHKPMEYEEELNELNSLIDGYISNNSKASKINEILTKPDPRIMKIYTQLKDDFENCKTWDDNGLCYLHKAILDDRINDAKRHILILKTRKESIDLRTSSGKTGLELAIEHHASAAMVKLLLNKGAQPVFQEPAHDSALHIACRISSPMVSQLIQFISRKALLNHIDSEGYAPIHYCAKTGSTAVLNALLKAGADANLRDHRSGRTALFHALENDFNDVAQRLVQSGANASIPNFSGQNVLPLIDGVKSLALRTALHRAII